MRSPSCFGRLVLLVLAIAPSWSCATAPEPRWIPDDERACNTDTDCEIVQGDVVAETCCGGCSEPYAISRRAAERHAKRAEVKCADTPCLMWRQLCCGNTKRSDWKAVCSAHVCERRSPSFFSTPKPRCE